MIHMKVSDLFIPDERLWDSELVGELFGTREIEEVLSILIAHAVNEDVFDVALPDQPPSSLSSNLV